MSYIIYITRNEVPADDTLAWDYVDQLLAEEDMDGGKEQDFLSLIEKLKATYPCICDVPEGIWSDGPLANNAGKHITVLGLSKLTEESIPVIAKITNDNGFVLCDMQDGEIYRPAMPPSARSIPFTKKTTVEPPSQQSKPFWKKLFGN